MMMIGMTIRSAQINEITPPKLMPCDHSRLASGMFPTEQTNEIMAMIGPTSAFSINRPTGDPVCKNNPSHQSCGTSVIKTQSTAPSSITNLVEANINARAGMSAAPCCIALRAAATAAYEQELLAAPKPVANETDFKFVWANSRLICSLPTKTWRTPEMVKPSTSAQNVAQSIASA